MEVGFRIDPEKCTECKRCMAACSLVKLRMIQLRLARIRVGTRWPETPSIDVCRFDDCEGQPCIASCPVEAILNEDGFVLIDRKTCTGCGVCVEACPYAAIWQDTKGIAYKCDYCGGKPACVQECVTEALTIKGG